MSAWKQFEREVGLLIDGRRFWANSGEQIDVEGASIVAQAKLVQRMSLEALTQLAETVEEQGRQRRKSGIVAIKCRRGRGRPSPTLIVMTAQTWRVLYDKINPIIRTLEARPEDTV